MRLLVIGRLPLGYLTHALKLCQYAAAVHEVHHLGFESPRYLKTVWKTTEVPGVGVHTVSSKGGLLSRYARWIRQCVIHISREQWDCIYLYYFPTCSLLRLAFPKTSLVLDIRSGPVQASRIRRALSKVTLMLEVRCFRRVHVLSEGLRRQLRLSNRAAVIPLGADVLSVPEKRFESLHLLYVGTFHGRRIQDTLLGFAKFCSRQTDIADIRYTIIGAEPRSEFEQLRRAAEDLGVSERVHFMGYVPHDALLPYLERANVGVSYVPITPYFDHQPPTKTFEYLLCGMPVVGTATAENRRVINDANGVLVADRPEDFCRGLFTLWSRRFEYDSNAVRASVASYAWDAIMKNRVLPAIESAAKRAVKC